MSNLIEATRDTYAEMWGIEPYIKNSPGEQLLPIFRDMTSAPPQSTLIDAGCGAGRGAVALQKAGFDVRAMCDITDAGLTLEAKAIPFAKVCLWEPLAPQLPFLPHGKADYVYCCDVLEHVPTALTMLTVSRLLEVARHGVFLSVSFAPDTMGVWIGKTLHETIQPFTWWRDHLAAIGHVVEARDMILCGAFLVQAR